MPLLELSRTFTAFFNSEKAGGVVLIVCTIVSLIVANSVAGESYAAFWQITLAGLTIEHWVNDGLMAVFFLLVGLELERELYNGELSSRDRALLPIIAALGGVCLPALIHFMLNGGTPTQPGMGIPMATDIAFALGVLSLAGKSVPGSLKVFLAALAVMDDLAAILVIAVFYTSQLSLQWLAAAAGVLVALVVFNRVLRWMALTPYLVGGALLWFCMLKSGVHATIAGVVLAFAIPFSSRCDDETSPSHRLEHLLHKPVAFFVLPVFALANTGIAIVDGWWHDLLSANSLGIMLGLFAGKPVGITLFCVIAVALGLARLPEDLGWRHVIGAGMLGGIGFTMSIFITNLAFTGQPQLIDASKMAILMASLASGVVGLVWLRRASCMPEARRDT